MATYTAKFSGGFVKTLKNSRREYAAAWAFKVVDTGIVASGFAADRAKAERAMQAELNWFSRHGRAVEGQEIVDVERGC